MKQLLKTPGRFLLKIQLDDGQSFDKDFTDYESMRDYILARSFFFVTADYSVYDLAIQLKESK